MRKIMAILFAMMVCTCLACMGAGTAAAEAAVQTCVDLANPETYPTVAGMTWKTDGAAGTLTLNGVNLKAEGQIWKDDKSFLSAADRFVIRFPEDIATVNIVLSGENIMEKTGGYQTNIFQANGKKVNISGNGTLTIKCEDTASCLVRCESMEMQSGAIKMAEGQAAGDLFRANGEILISGGSIDYSSNKGILSQNGPIKITGGDIKQNMSNANYGLYVGETQSDLTQIASPAIEITGGKVETNGSIFERYRGLKLSGGAIIADKRIEGDLFYNADTVTLPENLSTQQLTTKQSTLLEIPAGKTLVVPESVSVKTAHMQNYGTLDNKNRVTVTNGYSGEGIITGGGLLDLSLSYFKLANRHTVNGILRVEAVHHCKVCGNSTWNAGWTDVSLNTLYVAEGAKLTVPGGATVNAASWIMVHDKDSIIGDGSISSQNYYIEYSEDTVTPSDEIDLTYAGQSLQAQAEEQLKKRTPDFQMMGQTFSLGGQGLRVFYSGNSSWPAKEDHYVKYTYTLPIEGQQNFFRNFAVKKLRVTENNVQVTVDDLICRYTGNKIIFPSRYVHVSYNGADICSNFTFTYENNIDVGEATMILTGSDNVEGELRQAYQISPMLLNSSNIVVTESPIAKTYDGTTSAAADNALTLTGIVSRDAGHVTLTADASYDNANVGEGKTVAFKNFQLGGERAKNYEFAASAQTYQADIGKITPAPLTVTGAASDGRKYDGTNVVDIKDVTLAGIAGNDDVSVDAAGLTGTINGTDAGDYTAVTLPNLTLAGTAKDNYALTQPTGAVSCNVTIAKAEPLIPKPGDLTVANKREYTYTFGLGALRPDAPDGQTLGSTAVTYTLGDISLGDYYATGAEIDGQTLTLPVQPVDSEEVEPVGTVEIMIHTQNFADMTATINVRSVNKIIPAGEPTLSASSITFGQTVGTITLSGSMKDGETDVPGKFEWANPENKPAVMERYDAAWTFTPDDNDTYAIVNGASQMKVLPAPIDGAKITLSAAAFKEDGTEHKPDITSVELGGVVLAADTDYTAEIQSGTDAGTYTVTVIGTGNYAGTVKAAFVINPVESVEVPEKLPNGAVLKVEVETGLSTVPEGLKNMEAMNTPEKLETVMRIKITESTSTVSKENTAVYDVSLLVSADGGKNWMPATKENFPAGGLTVTLPYPSGTDSSYKFTVVHMFTTTDFGKTIGGTETPAVTNTANGLQFKVTGLSPISVGWEKKSTGGPGPTGTPSPEPWKNPFPDVSDTGWYIDAVEFVCREGLMVGYANGKFGPNDVITRAQFAQIIYNKEGRPEAASGRFIDVPDNQWYAEAVNWAATQGIVAGIGGGKFAPDEPITREQLATMLWRYAGSLEPAKSGLDFTDSGKVSEYAWKAICWANENGIVNGKGHGILDPKGTATRAEAAQMLMRYLNRR